jgi:hypothetical protein
MNISRRDLSFLLPALAAASAAAQQAPVETMTSKAYAGDKIPTGYLLDSPDPNL